MPDAGNQNEAGQIGFRISIEGISSMVNVAGKPSAREKKRLVREAIRKLTDASLAEDPGASSAVIRQPPTAGHKAMTADIASHTGQDA